MARIGGDRDVAVPAQQPVRILVVDDVESNLVALEALLGSPSVTVTRARSGRDALGAQAPMSLAHPTSSRPPWPAVDPPLRLPIGSLGAPAKTESEQNRLGDSMVAREHWESVYERKEQNQLSWYRPHLERSLRLIDEAGLDRDAAIIDVGGGTSTLVDDLLGRGYANITVLDISPTAIDAAKVRLRDQASAVRWLVADITQVALAPQAYDFWHDRAVFHFLRDEEDRRRYVAAVARP